MFLLSTTSYIWPADILTNVKKLGKFVDGIQIILFEFEEENNLPNPIEINELRKLKTKYNLSYFIHLPLNINFYQQQEFEINKVIKQLENIINIGEQICAEYYVAHLNLPEEKGEYNYKDEFNTVDYNKFYSQCCNTLDKIFSVYNIKHKFLIENINYNIDYLKKFLTDYNLNLCLDIGHLLLHNDSLEKIIEFKDYIKLIHLHDIEKKSGKDHYHLNDNKNMNIIFNYLKQIKYKGHIILEIFSKKDFFKSIDFMKVNGFFKYFKARF